ncbi:MAG: YggU family protein [Desulfobacterales bacterium]|nr:MAG: YggU family protein [Desulfobacterales bacterium]
MALIKEDTDGITFKVYIQPRSSKNMIIGPHGDAIKIKLTAPPVDNAANKMCIEYLAKCFKVPKKSIEIVSGHNSRTKRIHLRYTRENNATRAEQDRIKQRVISLIGR